MLTRLLTWSVTCNDRTSAEMIIEAGADVNMHADRDPLLCVAAARYNSLPMVELLLENKADINCVSYQCSNPALVVALANYNYKTALLLIRK